MEVLWFVPALVLFLSALNMIIKFVVNKAVDCYIRYNEGYMNTLHFFLSLD